MIFLAEKFVLSMIIRIFAATESATLPIEQRTRAELFVSIQPAERGKTTQTTCTTYNNAFFFACSMMWSCSMRLNTAKIMNKVWAKELLFDILIMFDTI